ncbi:hypothetical protein [Arthrobacter glacialis]|uniref:hypothetical protein n=1 Tax=Arthrobacter glacialis TaxID=1664 RepID=UPI000CD436CD|nr:hypothetical protein [Arthrobacter glacialis]POH56849.1 hypothetical protein CVS28_18705 [Arthrobacter glacialis]
MPATKPFFVPPVVPEVAERIPVTGPLTDVALADEWVLWFSDLLADHLDMPSNAGIEYMSLADRAPAFHANLRAHGMMMTSLVQSIEKNRGNKAAPFELDVLILPVAGFWLHRAGPNRVLLSESARRDAEQLRRLLGPIIAELA